MTFGSLFTGIGGMDLGLERAGHRCIWQVESHPKRVAVLERHWPDVKRHDDVQTFVRFAHDMKECECCEEEPYCEIHGMHFGECGCVGISEFADEWGVPDLIAGGDPCQENSNARRSAATRSPSLGGEFIRIVEHVRPRFVLRENPSVVRADAPWPWFRFRAELERLGYAVLPFRLRACCVGADYRRDRLFLLAELPGTEREGLEGNVRPKLAREDQGRQDADTAGPDRWSAAPRVCGGACRVPGRMDRLEGLGNAVCPAVAEWIGRRLMAAAA